MPILTLPEDIGVQYWLEKKLEEYKHCLDSNHPSFNPDFTVQMIYEFQVLEGLINDGEVDTEKMLSWMMRMNMSDQSITTFRSACGIIESFLTADHIGSILRMIHPRPGYADEDRRVVLLQDYDPENLLGIEPGDMIFFETDKDHNTTGATILNLGTSDPDARCFIPKGTRGTIERPSYSAGIFNYDIECPVKLDVVPDRRLPKTIGIPPRFLRVLSKAKPKFMGIWESA